MRIAIPSPAFVLLSSAEVRRLRFQASHEHHDAGVRQEAGVLRLVV